MTVSPIATRVIRWQERHAIIADTLLAAVILVLNLPLGLIPAHQGLFSSGRWLLASYIVWFICGIALTLRRRFPVLTWGIVTCAPPFHLAIVIGFYHPIPADVTLAIDVLSAITLLGTPLSLATLASRYRFSWVASACVISSLISTFTQCVNAGDPWYAFSDYILQLGLVNIVGTLVGLILRIQHAQLLRAQEHSARLALAREQTLILAAANERSRIAREMHDIVAHSLAVMITMSDGAAAAIDSQPEVAKEALTVLGETGRSALADTRRLVGVLRDDPGASSVTTPITDELPPSTGPIPTVRDLPIPEFAPPGIVAPTEPSEPITQLRRQATDASADLSAGDTPLTPAPETADLDTLVERFQAAGVPVSYTWNGAPLPEDKNLQLTLFRIAQESMTNILRYAPTTRRVEVTVQRDIGVVVLTVTNDAAHGTTPMHGSGKGLIGMRERAAVYGGTVEAGPTPTGWHVRAVLRWDDDEEGTSPWQMPA